jgi:type II secretory pathway pseudopilin PulG
MIFSSRFQKAYTIIEILVAGFIFTILMTISGTSLFFLLQAREATLITNNLYEETRFVMERIVREARVNTIDYYEYFAINHRDIDPEENEYGSLDNPGEYEMRFYYIPNYSSGGKNDPSSPSFSWKQEDRQLDTDVGKFDTGGNATEDAAEDYQKRALIPSTTTIIDETKNWYKQTELILISPDGLEKTIIKVIEDTNTVPGEALRRLAMAKMRLIDDESPTETDTTPDHWVPQDDYKNETDESLQFVYITPPELVVAETNGFYVYISPLNDPKKAFAQFGEGNEIPNVQPHVTIVLNTTVSQRRARAMRGPAPTLALQTTVSSRVYNEITFPRP